MESLAQQFSSNQQANTRFAAGTIFLRKNGIVLPIDYGSAPKHLPRCRPLPL